MARFVMLAALLLSTACSSPAERHMKRALCAGQGAVTHQDFIACELRRRKGP